MNRKEMLVVSGIIALTMTGGGFAFGASVNNVNSEQQIYACVTGVNGNITKVSNAPHSCPKGTTPLSWNIVGLKGDQGIQGIKGVQGDKGDTGASGATYGAYITNNKNEHVADVVSFNALTGVATIRVNKSYWYFTDQDGISSIVAVRLRRASGSNQSIQPKYFLTSDCSGAAYYPDRLQNVDEPWSTSYNLYNGLSLVDTGGYIESPVVAQESSYYLRDMHSQYRDIGFNNYSLLCSSFSGSGGRMFELKPFLPNLGASPRIVSSGDN